MRPFILSAFFMIAAGAVEARLGERPEVCARLYKEWVRAPLFAPDRALPTATGPGSTNLVYLSEQWRIRIGFIDGKAQRLEYSNAERPMTQITPEEIARILNANGGTSKWRKILRSDFKQPNAVLDKILAKEGAEAWMRRDGAIGQLRFNGSRFFVESYSIIKREMEAAGDAGAEPANDGKPGAEQARP